MEAVKKNENGKKMLSDLSLLILHIFFTVYLFASVYHNGKILLFVHCQWAYEMKERELVELLWQFSLRNWRHHHQRYQIASFVLFVCSAMRQIKLKHQPFEVAQVYRQLGNCAE
jgi:hypothetical protein